MSTRQEGFKFFSTLADRYEGLVKKLDTSVGEAIVLLEKANQKFDFLETRDFQKIIGLLDEAVFKFRVWASDLTYQNFSSRSEKLAMRDLSTYDVLNIVDASQTPIVEGLHRTFDQIENNTLTLSHHLESMTSLDKKQWISYYASLDKAADSIEQALVELNKHKSTIRVHISHATAEDFERGLLSDGIISGKASALSIDGGGVKSYSSILIIKALMKEVRLIVGDGTSNDVHSLGVDPINIRPSDIFEYHIGSSSGGLIAILLGRLKMSEDQCMESFQKYADEIFSRRGLFKRFVPTHLLPKYGSDRINQAIKMVVGNFDPSPDSHKWKRNLFAVPGEKCKTGVTAYALQGNAASTHIFRTYSQTLASDNSLPDPAIDCQIWEVARATSAVPDFFPPMTIGQTNFIDGGFGTNNPARVALSEIQASRKVISPYIQLPKILIISVGSGVRSQVSVSDSSNPRNNLVAAARSLITDTEAAHRDMKVISESQGIDYFRFAVDSGLSDFAIDSWEVKDVDGRRTFATLEMITKATETYLKQEMVVGQLRQCARLLVDRCRSNPFSSQSASSLSTIPFSRNPDFVGHEEILDRIQKVFQRQSHVALVGLGAIGKTQIAIEYGYRHRTRHPSESVFWVNAGTSSTFEQSMRSIAEAAKIPHRGEAEADVFHLVYNWLRYDARDRWLMILDNVEDESILDQPFGHGVPSAPATSGISSVSMSTLLLQNPEGQIIITSRSKDIAFRLMGSYQTVIEVLAMPAAESLDLFLKTVPENCDRGDAQELVEALDGLPLAIVMAAAYIARRAPRLTVRDFMAQWQERRFSMDNLNDPRYENSLHKTWEITFEGIRGHKPSAWRLLSLMSLCGPVDIPDYLVRDYQITSKDNPMNDGLDFEDDISTLTSYSLININTGGDLFSIHRLVQFEVKRWLETSHDLIIWKQKYLEILTKEFPERTHDNLQRCAALFTYVNTALTYRPADERYLRHWTTILIRVARYAEVRGDYERAEELNLRALAESEKLLGMDDPKTLESVDNLALVYTRKGKYEEAEIMSRRALDGREKVLGPEDPDTMTSQSNLATILLEKGDYEAAEKIGQQILYKRLQVLGEQHPDTFISLCNLALIFQHERRVEAEEMIRQALKGQMNVLGVDHPNTLLAMSILASVLRDQGKFEEAKATYEETLEGLQKTLGSEHPRTLITINSLAIVLRDQGNFEAAEQMTRRALGGLEKILGNEHPATLASANNLALILERQGNWKAATEAYQGVYAGRQKVLGPQHPDTLESAENCTRIDMLE